VFYDRFYQMCQNAGVTPSKVADDLGLNKSTVYMWKKQGTTPKYQTLKKLEEYFGCDLTDLVSPEEGGKKIVDHIREKLGEKNQSESDEIMNLDMKASALASIYSVIAKSLKLVKEKSPEELKAIDIRGTFVSLDGEEITNVDELINHASEMSALLNFVANKHISAALNNLTDDGQKKVASYAEDLAKIPEYRRQEPQEAPQPTPPAQEGNDTPAPESSTEGPQEPPDGE